MNSRKIAAIAILIAAATSTNYAMMPLYNIKLMDTIVFIGGFCFGPLVGAIVGALSWVVYGTVNPLGFSLSIWLATLISESVFGIVGGLAGRSLGRDLGNSSKFEVNVYLSFAALGALLTIAYDVATNVAWGFTYGPDVLVAVIIGVPFSAIHVLSNALFFGVGCVPAINAVSSLGGVGDLGILEQ